MNIFVLSLNPQKAAQYHCDKHCVKMIVELYQQMGSALRRHGAEDDQMPLTKAGKPLRGGYPNHPCTRWTGDSDSNFLWASVHALSLCQEYTFRYGKEHFCERGIYKMSTMIHHIPIGPLTPFALAMPEEFRCEDPVKSYRDYYWHFKRHTISMKWDKGRPEPFWWVALEEEEYAV